MTIQLSEDEQEKVITQVIKEIDEAISERSDEESKWEKWETEQYLGDLPAKNHPWLNASNVNSSMTMEAVNDTDSRVINTIFPFRPYVKIKGRGKEDIENAPAVEDYWDYLTEEMELVPEASQWFTETIKIGTGVICEYYIEGEHTKRERKDGKIVEKTEQSYKGPKVELLDLKDFIIPKKSKSVQYPDSRFACRVYRLSLDQIKRKEKEGKFINVKKLLELIKEKKTDPNKQFELYEYWGRWIVDDDEETGLERNVVFTILKEEKIVLKSTLFTYDHNYRPFVLINFLRKKGSIYGLGLCEMISHIHNTESTIFNQMIDNAALVNNKMTKARKGAELDVKLYPGANIEMDNMDDVQVFELGDLHISSFELLNVCRRYFERVSKVTDFTSGMRSSTRKGNITASEVMALIKEGSKWFDRIMKNMLRGYREILKQGTGLLQQYMSDDVEYQKAVMGEGEEIPFKKISKKQIAGNFDYIFQAKTVINEQLEEAKAMAFYQLAMQNPLVQKNPELLKDVTKDLFTTQGKKDIADKLDKFYPTTPEQKKAAMEAKKKEQEEEMKLAEEMAEGMQLPPQAVGGMPPAGMPA